MKIILRGHVLTQAQLDAIVPVLNLHMHGRISKAKFESAAEQACADAGCPVPEGIGPEGLRKGKAK